MARRVAHLTLDNVVDLPDRCRGCLFWELDPVRRARVGGAADDEKESWVSHVLLEWGSCGRVVYVDDVAVGYLIFAPARYVPGADSFPTAPVSQDAVLLTSGWVHPDHAGGGLGRVLVQAVVKDLVQRGDARALEAFGDTRGNRSRPGNTAAGGNGSGRGALRQRSLGRTPSSGPPRTNRCVLPTDFLLGVGFKTHRPHPVQPRMRLELRSVVTWRDEVEAAVDRLIGVVSPRPAPAPEPLPRRSVPRRRRRLSR